MANLFKAVRKDVCWISKKLIFKFLLGEKIITICKDRGLYYTILGNCIERENQNFRCLPDPNMNKYLKFGYLCRRFWFLGFEKGLEVPQDPAYSWFQSGSEEHMKSGIMLLCYVCFWSSLDCRIVEACTRDFLS